MRTRRARLSMATKQRLLDYADSRINKDGIVVIKAQRFRSQDKNKQDAIGRLNTLLSNATRIRRKRIATKPGKGVIERRLQDKKKTGKKKSGRGSVSVSDI